MDEFKVNLENLTDNERDELIHLVEKANKPQSKVWKPQKNETYFYIISDGCINKSSFQDTLCCNGRFKLGNCYKTKEEAEFDIEKLKVIAELKNYAIEHNKDTIDWKNKTQEKVALVWSVSCGGDIACVYDDKFKRNGIYFTSFEVAKEAVKAIGKERIKKYYLEATDE